MKLLRGVLVALTMPPTLIVLCLLLTGVAVQYYPRTLSSKDLVAGMTVALVSAMVGFCAGYFAGRR
jgi:apolipoprotein N-acyltransferase